MSNAQIQSLTGKVVIITGASSGLGEATARYLAARGAKLVLAARRTDKLQALAAELSAAGTDVLVQATDVTDMAQVQALADATLKRFARIDVLVNNAGIMPLAPLAKLKVDEWSRMIDVNIKGVLHGVAAVLPTMTAQAGWPHHQHRLRRRPQAVYALRNRLQRNQVRRARPVRGLAC